MDNFNIDENSINKLKDMMYKGDLSDVISQIPPEMLQNFSKMMTSNSNNENNSNANNSNTPNNNDIFNANNNSNTSNSNNNFNTSATNNNFDFSKIDMNTVMKMKSIMDKMNTSNDPRTNLLNSLKPYLREERKSKLDQYANLMNVAKIAELFNSENKPKENNSND